MFGKGKSDCLSMIGEIDGKKIVESLNVRKGKSKCLRGKFEKGRKGREKLRRISDEIGIVGGEYEI